MGKLLLIVMALVAGSGLALQAGLNNGLRARAGHPIPAAFLSFLVGTLALAGYLAVARPPRAPTAELARGPWWIWTGGLVGAVYVASAAAFSQRLGAAGWLGLVIAGQVLASLALDHFGLVGFATHPVNGPRLLGAALLLAGVALVLRS